MGQIVNAKELNVQVITEEAIQIEKFIYDELLGI